MNILDHLGLLEVIEEKSTYIICKCPNCAADRLKISKRPQCLGAYKCWSGCSTEEVKTAMNLGKDKNYYLSPYRKIASRSAYSTNLKIEQAKQVNFTPNISQVIKVPENFSKLEQTVKRFISSQKTITIYPYSDHQRVYRLDSTSGKEIYLQHKTHEDVWEAGTGDKDWPVYARGLDFALDGDTVLFVEGEKVAEFVKAELGLAAITVASHVFSKEFLYRSFYLFFKKAPKKLNVLIVPDDDAPGYKKATLVSQMLNYLKIPNYVTNLVDIASTLNLDTTASSFEPTGSTGLDLADFKVNSNSINYVG
jgi:hypothetical protein